MSTVMTMAAGGVTAGVAAHIENVPARLHLLLKLRPEERTTIESLSLFYDGLLAIDARHRRNEDPLSVQLHDFADSIYALHEMIEDLPPGDVDSLQIIIDKAKILIKNLRENVLVDSLYRMPLKHPLMEGEWIWDEEILQACINTYRHPPLGYTPESPITNAPFGAMEVHASAAEMLNLLSTLPPEFLLPTIHEVLAIAHPEEVYVPEDPAKMEKIKTPEEMEKIETPEEQIATLPPIDPEVRAALLASLQTPFQQRCAERKERYMQRYGERNKLITANYCNFRSAGDIAKAKETLDRTAEEIEALRQSLRTSEDTAKRIAAEELVSRRIASEAHSQLVLTSIQAMKQAHKDEKDLLTANIAEVERKLANTQADLEEKKITIKEHSEKIAALLAHASSLQGQLNYIQGQKNDGGRCSIM